MSKNPRFHNKITKSGSVTTGLNLPISDLNIQVNLKYRNYDDKSMMSNAIDFVEAMAKDTSLTKCISWDDKIGLFIVKMELSKKFENFRVEIIFRIFNHLTFPKNEDVVSEYLAIYPQSRPLYLIVRTLLHKAKLDDPGTYGINNFSLFLLIIAFCQKFAQLNNLEQNELSKQINKLHNNKTVQNHHKNNSNNEKMLDQTRKSSMTRKQTLDTANMHPINDKTSQYDNLGDLIIKFFYFFGYSFDYVNTYICPFLPKDRVHESFFQVI